MKEDTKMVDVVSVVTGEVYMTFDMIWLFEMKRYIKGWIKENGYEIDRYENGTVYVKEKAKFDLVRNCYEDVIHDLNETQNGSEPEMPHTSEIIRDWKCSAAEEWDDLTVEQVDKLFDEIYKIVDEEATQRAMEYC